jgi:hypothetical protein
MQRVLECLPGCCSCAHGNQSYSQGTHLAADPRYNPLKGVWAAYAIGSITKSFFLKELKMLTSVSHIALFVPDLQEAERFYQDLFEMELIG